LNSVKNQGGSRAPIYIYIYIYIYMFWVIFPNRSMLIYPGFMPVILLAMWLRMLAIKAFTGLLKAFQRHCHPTAPCCRHPCCHPCCYFADIPAATLLPLLAPGCHPAGTLLPPCCQPAAATLRLWCSSGAALVLLWSCSDAALGPLWCCSGTALVLPCCHPCCFSAA
jgi:hypothetical protein